MSVNVSLHPEEHTVESSGKDESISAPKEDERTIRFFSPHNPTKTHAVESGMSRGLENDTEVLNSFLV